MSDVSKTNDLIAEARRLEGDYSDNHEVVTHMSVLADALESVRAERDAALARIAEAAKLHQPQPGQGVRYCADCDQRWPCPTAVSLGLNEGENENE